MLRVWNLTLEDGQSLSYSGEMQDGPKFLSRLCPSHPPFSKVTAGAQETREERLKAVMPCSPWN